jgi:hypothetical protein
MTRDWIEETGRAVRQRSRRTDLASCDTWAQMHRLEMFPDGFTHRGWTASSDLVSFAPGYDTSAAS